MNVSLLIDGVVRQTTVLLAQLATAGGVRAPLSDVAGQVFRDLANELHLQGLTRKVQADMFGMALRTYRRKIQQHEESRTQAGRSLWEAAHEAVTATPGITRSELLRRFERDDEPTLRAVLQDLVDSGLLYRSGHGADTSYRAVSREELEKRRAAVDDSDGTDTLVWGAVYRSGGADRATLGRAVPLSENALGEALNRLVEKGRVQRLTTAAGERFEADGFVIPFGSPVGWEAAVFDHFQALVGTIGARLRGDSATAAVAERVGGSTYTLEVWSGHPLEEEALSELRRFRERSSALRRRIAAHNESVALPKKRLRVVVYGGQNVLEVEDAEGET